MLQKLMVVFVCSFNGCRSVVAEYFLRKVFLEKDKELSSKVEITSAGMVSKKLSELLRQKGIPEPRFGKACQQQVIEIASKRGVDVSKHKSKAFDRDLAERANLIITMEEFQKREILSRYLQSNGKVFTFREFFEISDPIIVEDSFALPEYNADTGWFGYPYEYDELTMDVIKQCLTQGVEKILNFLNLT